jgi:hypothetical protein
MGVGSSLAKMRRFGDEKNPFFRSGGASVFRRVPLMKTKENGAAWIQRCTKQVEEGA